jgi:hypothetical protein
MFRAFSTYRVILIVVAGIALACAGCSPAARLHGQWQVDTNKLKSDLAAAKDNPLAGLAAGFMAMVEMNLEFKADGTCSGTATMLGQSKTAAGTWRYVENDGEVIVIAVKMDDQPEEREVRVKFSDDDHLEMVPPVDAAKAAGGTTLPFTRVKPK